MASYKLTRAAEADLDAISRYTLNVWNEQQALKYVEELFDCIEALARRPGLDKFCPPRIGKEYQRFQQGKHWIYYKSELEGITVIRVLHQRMDQWRQIFAYDVVPLF